MVEDYAVIGCAVLKIDKVVYTVADIQFIIKHIVI